MKIREMLFKNGKLLLGNAQIFPKISVAHCLKHALLCLFFRQKMSQRKGGRGAILRRRTKHDDDLPDEIVLDILSKLPVKSLLRFRCVCKPWHSSIANPNFISTHHLNLNHSHHHSYVIHIPRNIPEPSSSFPGSSRSSGQLCTLTCDRTFVMEFRVQSSLRLSIWVSPRCGFM